MEVILNKPKSSFGNIGKSTNYGYYLEEDGTTAVQKIILLFSPTII